MGQHIGAVLIVGLDYQDFPDSIKVLCEDEGIYDHLGEESEYGLDSASPWYDSDSEDRIWGYVIASGELPGNLEERIDEAKVKFFNTFGVAAEVHVSPNVT